MRNARLRIMATACALTSILTVFYTAPSQEAEVLHQIEGRLQFKAGTVGGMRVRLIRKDSLEPVGDTFSHTDGAFSFSRVSDGDYLVETFETDVYEATSTELILRPRPRRSISFNVFIEIPLKDAPTRTPAGVVTADVDLNVPKAASKHYRNGSKALKSGDTAGAVAEFQEAIAAYSNYYAARLDLGRELRLEKRFKEAEAVLNPLPQIAPKRAEPRLEYGIVLLALQQPDEAANQLREAVKLEEANWATHLYLGWALLESRADEAEQHLKRALELDEKKAAKAHLALARIADAQGQRQIAIQHLDAYLALVPNAPDAEAARRLAETLRH